MNFLFSYWQDKEGIFSSRSESNIIIHTNIIINFIHILLDLASEILLYNQHCIFLGSNKRDLNDKSRNGEDSKKHRENSDSASSLQDDAFSDGFNSSACAKISRNCFKSIKLQVNNILRPTDTKNSQIKGEKQSDSLADALELMSAKFDELERLQEKR